MAARRQLNELRTTAGIAHDLLALLKLDPDREIVLYGVALGRAATPDRCQRRRPAELEEPVRHG